MKTLTLIAAIMASVWTVSMSAQRESSVAGPAFEVASIKRTAPADRQQMGFPATPGRFTAIDVPASALIGFAYGGTLLRLLASRLSVIVGQQVVDDTGLPGAYAFVLKYSSNQPGFPEPTDEYPDVTTALREQLGMKMVRKKTTVNILVVDRFDRPTED